MLATSNFQTDGQQGDTPEVIEGAEVVQSGSDMPPPQPVAFFAEVETITMLMKYEKIAQNVIAVVDDYAKVLEDYGIPSPFSYIIVITSSILSLYTTRVVKSLVCPPKKAKPTHVFNTLDSVDMSKLMIILQKIEKQGILNVQSRDTINLVS